MCVIETLEYCCKLMHIQVHNADEFVRKLACAAQDKLKVVSIFGNTGDGKSHTLNHTFFEGEEVWLI